MLKSSETVELPEKNQVSEKKKASEKAESEDDIDYENFDMEAFEEDQEEVEKKSS